MTNTRPITMIGGFGIYGSGKYMRAMSDSLERSDYEVVKISTNGMRFRGMLQMVRMLFNSSHRYVVFQPSISGVSFLRDVIILIITRILACDVAMVVLSHIFYKNHVFKLAWVRSLFFRARYVIGAADISEIRDMASEFAVITPTSSAPFSTVKRGDNPGVDNILFLYIGYFDTIKGFDRFIKLASQNEDQQFQAIGDFLSQQVDLPIAGKNIQYIVSTPESDFSKNVRQAVTRQGCLPVLLYTSRYDLAPFLILELGAARVPVCVKNNTDSYQILKNFLPQGAFFAFEELADIIEASRSGELSRCVDKLEAFSLMQGRDQFDDKLLHLIGKWMYASI